MNFSLKQDENTTNSNGSPRVEYQKPGIYDNVQVTEVILGKSSQKGSPFIQLKTVGQNGEVGRSNSMYLSTSIGEGKKMAAWDMTKRNIADLIAATHNISKQEIETIELVPTNTTASIEEQHNMLAQKVASLIVGKPFRAKFKGEQSQTGTVFATLDKVENMQIPKLASGLRFNETTDIKLFVQAESAPVFGS